MTMIPFEEIDEHLKALGEDRSWLATNTPYSADYLRTVLAPNSTRRTERVQQVISDAIEKEEAARSVTSDFFGNLAFTEDEWELLSAMGRRESVTTEEWIVSRMRDYLTVLGIQAAKESAPAQSNVTDLPAYWLDLCGGIAAGAPISSDVPAAPIQVAKEYPSDHYALRVFGRSMEPKIPDGSLVVVQRLAEGTFPKQGGIVVYSDAYGLALKQLSYRKARADESPNAFGKVAVLKSLNPEFPEVATIDGGRLEAVFVEVMKVA